MFTSLVSKFTYGHYTSMVKIYIALCGMVLEPTPEFMVIEEKILSYSRYVWHLNLSYINEDETVNSNQLRSNVYRLNDWIDQLFFHIGIDLVKMADMCPLFGQHGVVTKDIQLDRFHSCRENYRRFRVIIDDPSGIVLCTDDYILSHAKFIYRLPVSDNVKLMAMSKLSNLFSFHNCAFVISSLETLSELSHVARKIDFDQ